MKVISATQKRDTKLVNIIQHFVKGHYIEACEGIRALSKKEVVLLVLDFDVYSKGLTPLEGHGFKLKFNGFVLLSLEANYAEYLRNEWL